MEHYNFDRLPILKSLYAYRDENVLPLHVPGHKMGSIYERLGLDYLTGNLLKFDITEVPGIDNLHEPEGAIEEAQQLAANTFGALRTFFLANGTTAGIQAMILAVTEPGDKIIIPRNCHRSVLGAVILGHLMPVYIQPETNTDFLIAGGISPEAVEKALNENPDAKAVVITSPSYYGICSDLNAIARIVHQEGKLLLVDEAHGAHFKFSKGLPITALEAGADLAAQSIHKTLPSMTQSSMLHVGSDRVDIDKLKLFLRLTQSSSPSHVLLASLDLARYIMESNGEILLAQNLAWSWQFKDEINQIKGLKCLDRNMVGKSGIYDIDETRLTVNLGGSCIGGTEADALLRQKFKIQVELSDLYNIVAVTTIGDDESAFRRLISALTSIAVNEKGCTLQHEVCLSMQQPTPRLDILPCEAIYKDKENVRWEESIGRTCSEMLVPYPPGIPVIMPGEQITHEIMEFLRHCVAKGIRINGANDPRLEYISVIK